MFFQCGEMSESCVGDVVGAVSTRASINNVEASEEGGRGRRLIGVRLFAIPLLLSSCAAMFLLSACSSRVVIVFVYQVKQSFNLSRPAFFLSSIAA